MCGEPGNKATSVCGFVHKVGYIHCAHALYSTCLVNGSDHTGHPAESLARESIFSQPVTGCKSKARLVRSVVVSCWSYIVNITFS